MAGELRYLTEGEKIDKLYQELYDQASDSRYGFSRFSMPWNAGGLAAYGKMKGDFSKTLRMFARECCVKSHLGELYMFTGKVYEKIDDSSVGEAYDMLLESFGISDAIGKPMYRDGIFIKVIKSHNRLNIRNDVVAFSNCVVDMRDLKNPVIHKHGPEYHVTDYHPYPFKKDYRSTRWEGFLREVLPDKKQREILQMFLGLGLIQMSKSPGDEYSSERPPVQLCLLLLGSGANGKSVLFTVMCALFGKQHISSISYDMLTAKGEEGLRGRCPIRNAVFNWCPDTNPKTFGKCGTDEFKRITSGEPVQYRLLQHNVMSTDSCPYLIFNLNELPSVADNTRGFMRRLQYVNFGVTIPKARQNPNLAYELIRYDLPAIFCWVMRGAMEIKRRHFVFPNSEESHKQKVFGLFSTNPVYSWVLAYGLRGDKVVSNEISSYIKSDTLYESFVKYYKLNNGDAEVMPSQGKFARELTRLQFERHRDSKIGLAYVVYGVTEDELKRPLLIDDISVVKAEFESDESLSYIKDD